MNKTKLIDAIATEASITKSDAERAVKAFIKVFTHNMKKGEKISIQGFGSFNHVKRKARNGTDPRNQTKIKIPARKTVKFKPGSDLMKLLNK